MDRQSGNLDLLRATAVMLVLLNHLLGVSGLWSSPLLTLWGVSYVGKLGVAMFFIHTSIVLMMSLERMSENAKSYRLAFYVRRAFRLYPLSVITLIAVLSLKVPRYFEAAYMWPGKKAVIANLLLIQNLSGSPSVTGPLWSLPFEVQMYILLPFIFIVAVRIRSHAGVLLLAAGGFALSWIESKAALHFRYPPLFTYAPWFAMGCASYSLSKIVRPGVGAKLWAPCLAAFVMLCFAATRITHERDEGWAITCLGALLAFALPHFREGLAEPVRRTAETVAKYSYGLYLWHVPILWFAFLKLNTLPRVMQSAICIALLVAVPVLLHRLIEAPMMRIGARLTRTALVPLLAERAAS